MSKKYSKLYVKRNFFNNITILLYIGNNINLLNYDISMTLKNNYQGKASDNLRFLL